MSIGICYSITNASKTQELIVHNLTDFMFDQGWRVVTELRCCPTNKALADINEEYFDDVMYAEYTLKCYA